MTSSNPEPFKSTAPPERLPARSIEHRSAALDVERIRADFPALGADGRRLHYLDSAASALTPAPVVEAVADAQRRGLANVHRGVHRLAAEATEAFEAARAKVAAFVRARSRDEIVFVRGATEGLNLVAECFARPRLGPGDEILVSEVEHHANLLPWQRVCRQTGARLVVAPLDDTGRVPLEALRSRLGERTRLLALAHVSNALGCALPVADIAAEAHRAGAVLVVDGAQAAPHLDIDVGALGCDFYAFSGHKLYGPDGIGVLWGREEWLAQMPPYQLGGDMVERVTLKDASYAPPPRRFEAGTPHVAGAIGLAAAIEYLQGLGVSRVRAHERALLDDLEARLDGLEGVRVLPAGSERVGVISFLLQGVHAHDLGTVADAHGVAIRTGHHCAQPLMQRLGVSATARASIAAYNAPDDLAALEAAIVDAKRRLS